MDVNSYLPGDQRLVDKIINELKSQGIFDQFRKECFSDVDTKPAYQNLRQRVEGRVAEFLEEQSWRPDMNKNQVREMLRKRITESGYLEIGVERIVDQVVNPKINSVFLPKVEDVVYIYLGIKKPNAKSEVKAVTTQDLLPSDLEAVSPEPEILEDKEDKKEEKPSENVGDLDDNKTEEDESPPFEPLDEQPLFVTHEENSVDSHMSGFSGLASHESNQSTENKVVQMEQDSQMSRNSSDSRLSIVTSDENSKMDIVDGKSSDSAHNKNEIKDKDKHKIHDKEKDRHKSRSDSKSDRDRRSSKDSKSRHSSSSKDKDNKSRDRKDSRSSSSTKSNKNDKDKRIDKNKHSSSKEKSVKRDSKSDKDRIRSTSSSSHSKDSKESKSKDKSKSSSSSHKHSYDRHKKDKDKDRKKSKDDHYSSKDKKNDRRSTDRDSNDGQSSKSGFTETQATQSQKTNQESSTSTSVSKSGGGDSGNSDKSESNNKKMKLFKPKCASNIQEALKLMKIRKQLARLEKENQLCLVDVNVNSTILESSINLDELSKNKITKLSQEELNLKIVEELEIVPSPLQNTVISQDNWDAMEAKLRREVVEEFQDFDEEATVKEIDDCRYFEKTDWKQLDFVQFVKKYIEKLECSGKKIHNNVKKRKSDDSDLRNNNKRQGAEKKRKIMKKIGTEISSNEKFSLPLSPAESDKSEKKDEVITPVKVTKSSAFSKMNNQRYSSDDLYKPRPTFAASRRRGAKNVDTC